MYESHFVHMLERPCDVRDNFKPVRFRNPHLSGEHTGYCKRTVVPLVTMKLDNQSIWLHLAANVVDRRQARVIAEFLL